MISVVAAYHSVYPIAAVYLPLCLVVLGDSISSAPNSAWNAYAYENVQVVNQSAPGASIRDYAIEGRPDLSHVFWAIAVYGGGWTIAEAADHCEPEVFSLSFGPNGAGGGFEDAPLEFYVWRYWLRVVVENIHALYPEADVWISHPPRFYLPPVANIERMASYSEAIDELIADDPLVSLGIDARSLKLYPRHLTDSVHPNDEGHSILAEAWAEKIERHRWTMRHRRWLRNRSNR